MKVTHLILSGVALLCLRGGMVLANPHLTPKDVAQTGFFPRIDYTSSSGKEDLQQPGVAARDYTRNGYALTLNQMPYDGFATSSDVKRLAQARLTRHFELLDAAEAAALEAGRACHAVIHPRQLMLPEENFGLEPYGIGMRRDDPEFNKPGDDTLIGMMKSGEFERLYNKRFMSPIPPNNINLQIPLREMPRDLMRNPGAIGT